MGGFIGGLLAGAVLVLAAAAWLSLTTPLPQRPEVAATPAASEPAAEPAEDGGIAAPGRDAGRNTGVASATASMSCDDAMRARVNQLLGPYGVPVPVLTRVAVTRTGAAADYLAGEIQFRRCLHDTELAHELAHHVVDWTAGSWAGVVATARGFCPGLDDRGACSHSWLSSRLVEFEASIGAPGVEHIAHCVGWALAGTGTFTRCDSDVFRDAAVDLLSAAG